MTRSARRWSDAIRATPSPSRMDLYDLVRVRGHFGGYYVDAIAGIDIALWDLFGKIVGQPVAKLPGGYRRVRFPRTSRDFPARRSRTR